MVGSHFALIGLFYIAVIVKTHLKSAVISLNENMLISIYLNSKLFQHCLKDMNQDYVHN